MPNRMTSPIAVKDYAPEAQPQGQLATVPRQFEGSQATGALQSISAKLADKFGVIADQAAQVEGEHAGAVAGNDPNFRPSGSSTIRGRATDVAAMQVYASNLTTNLGTDMAGAFEANKNDPAGFAAAALKIKQGYMQDHVFPEIQADFNKRFSGEFLTYQGRVASNFTQKTNDEQTASLLSNMDQRETNRAITVAAGTDPAVVRQQVDLSVADDLADIDNRVKSGAITAEAGEKLKLGIRHGAALTILKGDAAKLKSPDEIDAYRADLQKKFAGGELKDLDADNYAKLDASLGTLSDKLRTATTEAQGKLQTAVDDLNTREAAGYEAKQSEWTNLAMQAQQVPGGQAIFQRAQRRSALAAYSRTHSPEETQAYLDSLRTPQRSPSVFQPPANMAQLPAGMQNNNPGNLKYTSNPNLPGGAVGNSAGAPGVVGPSKNTDQGDRQVVYATPLDGMRAAVNLARTKYNSGMTTAAELISGPDGWTGGNKKAAESVASMAGVGVNDDLKLNTPGGIKKFMRGLLQQEHGDASKAYSDDLIEQAALSEPPAGDVPTGGPARGTAVSDNVPGINPVPGSKFNYASVQNMGDPRSPGWEQNNITTVQIQDGQAWRVNRQAAASFKGFLDDLAAEGYQAKSSGGYNLRNVRGGSSLSQHAWGNAIDIDAPNNAMGQSKTNLPANVRQLAQKWGLVWGMDIKGRPDPMHFEWAGPNGSGGASADSVTADGGWAKNDAEDAIWLQKITEQKRKDLAEDPLGVAEKEGTVGAITPYDPSAPDADAQLANRVTQAQAVAQSNGRAPVYLRPDEKSRLSAQLGQGGDVALQTLQGIVSGGREAAPAILKELGGDAPVMAQAGAVLAGGGSVPAVRDAMTAIKLKRDGTKLPDPPKSMMALTGDTMGRALDLNPDERGRITQLAGLIYGARMDRTNTDPTSSEAEKVYSQALQEASGAVIQNGEQYGGFGEIGGGIFGSRPSTVVALPSGMTAAQFNGTLDAIRDEDLAGLKVPPVGSGGQPYTAQDLAHAIPVRYGNGYRFQLKDPQTDELGYIRGQDGRPFVLSIDALQDIAAVRRVSGGE